MPRRPHLRNPVAKTRALHGSRPFCVLATNHAGARGRFATRGLRTRSAPCACCPKKSCPGERRRHECERRRYGHCPNACRPDATAFRRHRSACLHRRNAFRRHRRRSVRHRQPPRRLSGQGSHERHNRGQHDCANCNSAIFHEYLPPAAEKSDGPRHTPRYEMAACAALTYINIAKFTGPELNAHNSRPILDE